MFAAVWLHSKLLQKKSRVVQGRAFRKYWFKVAKYNTNNANFAESFAVFLSLSFLVCASAQLRLAFSLAQFTYGIYTPLGTTVNPSNTALYSE